MAHTAGRVPTMASSGFGKTFLVGGSIVFAGLTGFYMNMLHRKKAQELKGTNPHFERIVAHVSKPVDQEHLPVLNAWYSDTPPALPGKEHNSGHSTFKNFKQSSAYLENGSAARRMAPTPQRVHTDGSGRAYTKSPNFVDNYNKTIRPAHKEITDSA